MKIKLPDEPKFDLDKLLNTAVPTGAGDPAKPGSDTTGSSTTQAGSSTTGSDTTKGDRVNEWRKKTKDTIRFDVNHGGKPFLQEQAAKRGLTLTAMIKAALKEFLENHPL